MRRSCVCFTVLLFGSLSPWRANASVELTQATGGALNVSDYWICAALPTDKPDLPLFGIPVAYATWSWPYSSLNHSPAPTGEGIHWNFQEEMCLPGQKASQLPNGKALCWGTSSMLPNISTTTGCERKRAAGELNGSVKFELQSLGKATVVMRNDTDALELGSFDVNYTALNWSLCFDPCKGKPSCPNLTLPGCPPAVLWGLRANCSFDCIPRGLWWLCGDGKARKTLPKEWSGTCTLGYLIPKDQIFNRSHPREANPLVLRPRDLQSFERCFRPWLGGIELEAAVFGVSASLEAAPSATRDDAAGARGEISSWSD